VADSVLYGQDIVDLWPTEYYIDRALWILWLTEYYIDMSLWIGG